MHYSILGGGGRVVYSSAGQNIAYLPTWVTALELEARPVCTCASDSWRVIDFARAPPLQLWYVGAVEAAHGWLGVAVAPRRRCARGG